MANILDYIDWRGDLSFAENPVNEVDGLIFSTLSYLDMDDIAPASLLDAIPLSALKDRYDAAGKDQSALITDPSVLLERACASERFENVKVGGYQNIIDEEKQIQFSACTFLLDDGTAFLAFRGTDDTIVGWKEDFNFSLSAPTPGQKLAAAYVDRISKETDLPLFVGGHSKGGNFAVFGAAFCDEKVRENRIKKVFSNDGPGFNPAIAGTDEYRAVLPKVEVIIPESSLVGMLLTNKGKKIIIKSTEKGIGQHHAYSWQVMGARFVRADERGAAGAFMDKTVIEWVDNLTDEQKQSLSRAVFGSLEASGAKTLSDLSANRRESYNAILKAALSLDENVSKDLTTVLKELAALSRGALVDEAKKRFEKT